MKPVKAVSLDFAGGNSVSRELTGNGFKIISPQGDTCEITKSLVGADLKTLNPKTEFLPYRYGEEWVDSFDVPSIKIVGKENPVLDFQFIYKLNCSSKLTQNGNMYHSGNLEIDFDKLTQEYAKDVKPQAYDVIANKESVLVTLKNDYKSSLGLGDKIVLDPTYTITNLTSNVILNDVVCEGGGHYCHLGLNDTSLIFYMPFDVNDTISSSTLMYDWGNFNVDGTRNGNAKWKDGSKFGGGLFCDGNGDYLLSATNLDGQNDNESTVCAWAYADSWYGTGNYPTIIKSGTATTALRFELLNWNQKVLMMVWEGSGVQDVMVNITSIPSKLTWHHYCSNFNGSYAEIYLDGILNNSISFSSRGLSNAAGGIYIGYVGWAGGYWNGTIDELMIFNRSLSGGEISAIYNGTFSRFLSSGTLYYNLSITNFSNKYDYYFVDAKSKSYSCTSSGGTGTPAQYPIPTCGVALTDSSADTALSADDADFVVIQDAGSGVRSYSLYQYKLNESTKNINTLRFNWMGKTSNGGDDILFYIWNATNYTWKFITKTVVPDAEIFRQYDVPFSLDYLNSSGYIHFIAQTNKSASSAYILYVDATTMNVSMGFNSVNVTILHSNQNDSTNYLTNITLSLFDSFSTKSATLINGTTQGFGINLTSSILDFTYNFTSDSSNFFSPILRTNNTIYYYTQYPKIDISILKPTGNINASRFNWFEVSLNITCRFFNCENVTVTLDPYQNREIVFNETRGLVDDTSVSMVNPTTNYGTQTTMTFLNYSGEDTEVYVKFNISAIPHSAKIISANVSLHILVNALDADTEGYNVSVHEVFKTFFWNETSIIWNNKAQPGTNYNVTYTDTRKFYGGTGEPTGVLSWDVTNSLNSAFLNNGGNFSLVFVARDKFGTPANSDTLTVVTKEETISERYAPSLLVTYVVKEDNIIPTTIGEIPFYTNSTSNPQTFNLDVGESAIATFWVNATGRENTTHVFYAYSNVSLYDGVSNITSRFNVTITDYYELNAQENFTQTLNQKLSTAVNTAKKSDTTNLLNQKISNTNLFKSSYVFLNLLYQKINQLSSLNFLLNFMKTINQKLDFSELILKQSSISATIFQKLVLSLNSLKNMFSVQYLSQLISQDSSTLSYSNLQTNPVEDIDVGSSTTTLSHLFGNAYGKMLLKMSASRQGINYLTLNEGTNLNSNVLSQASLIKLFNDKISFGTTELKQLELFKITNQKLDFSDFASTLIAQSDIYEELVFQKISMTLGLDNLGELYGTINQKVALSQSNSVLYRGFISVYQKIKFTSPTNLLQELSIKLYQKTILKNLILTQSDLYKLINQEINLGNTNLNPKSSAEIVNEDINFGSSILKSTSLNKLLNQKIDLSGENLFNQQIFLSLFGKINLKTNDLRYYHVAQSAYEGITFSTLSPTLLNYYKFIYQKLDLTSVNNFQLSLFKRIFQILKFGSGLDITSTGVSGTTPSILDGAGGAFQKITALVSGENVKKFVWNYAWIFFIGILFALFVLAKKFNKKFRVIFKRLKIKEKDDGTFKKI